MGLDIFSQVFAPQIIDATPSVPTFTGPFATGQAVALILKQIGKLIIMEVPGISASPAVDSAATASGVIPTALRPLAQIFGTVLIVSNVAILAAPGRCSVGTNGDVVINADLLGTLNWLGVGNNGWSRFSLCWTIS